MAWALLVGAILLAVCGTVSLRLTTERSAAWWFGVVLGYVAAYSLLVASLARGMPLGVAYGIWAACSVGITALLSWALFGERFNRLMAFGLLLIISGVLLIEIGASSAQPSPEERSLPKQAMSLSDAMTSARSFSL